MNEIYYYVFCTINLSDISEAAMASLSLGTICYYLIIWMKRWPLAPAIDLLSVNHIITIICLFFLYSAS